MKMLIFALAPLSFLTTAIGVGLFVYGLGIAPHPDAPELYQRGYSSFVNQQELAAGCRGAGAGLFAFGLMLAGSALILLRQVSGRHSQRAESS